MRYQMSKYTIKDFNLEYPDDEACFNWIIKHVYPDGIYCPICERITKHHKDSKRRSLSCDRCGHHLHPTTGTIFEKSTTPLKFWFYAMFLMSATRCGISAKQLQRETGVTYKTAWRMFRQIRSMIEELHQPLKGVIEADETYMGGVQHGRGGITPNKVPVLGIVQRQGEVRTHVTKNIKWFTVTPFIVKNVAKRSIICTDELHSYNNIDEKGYIHRQVNHKIGQYSMGYIHTNTIEGFWSLLKRGINGVYHAVSPKYLQTYINEYSFRYNHRKDSESMFKTVLNQI